SAKPHRCTLRERTVCTYMGVLFSKGQISDTTVLRSVSVEEFQHARSLFLWKTQILETLSPTVRATRNQLDVKFKYCCYTSCSTNSNFILEEGSVFLTYDGKFHSDLMSTV